MIQFFSRQTIVQQIALILVILFVGIYVYAGGFYADLNTIIAVRISQSLSEGYALVKDIKSELNPAYLLSVRLFTSIGISLAFLSFLGLMVSLACVLVFYVILEKNDVFNQRTSFSLIVVCFAFIGDNNLFLLKPESIGLLFTLFAVDIFIEHFKTMVDDFKRHNMGFLIGIASLFYSPYFFVLVLMIVYLAVSSRISLRSYLLMAIGYLIPFVFLWAYFLMKGVESDWFFDILSSLKISTYDMPNWDDNLLWVAFSAIAFISFLGMSRLFLNNLQSSFKVFMLGWLLVFLFIRFFVDGNLSIIVVLPSLMYLFPFLIFSIKKYWQKEIIGLLATAAIVFCLFNMPEKESSFVKKFIPKSEKWMVLGEDISTYIMKKSASPFFDRDYTERLFKQKNDYFAIAECHHWISVFKPDVIYDPDGNLKDFENYLPLLEEKYIKHQQTNTYYLKK